MSTRSECSLAGAQVRTDFPAKEAQFAKGQTALPVLVSLAMCLGDESLVGEPEGAGPTILSCCPTAELLTEKLSVPRKSVCLHRWGAGQGWSQKDPEGSGNVSFRLDGAGAFGRNARPGSKSAEADFTLVW